MTNEDGTMCSQSRYDPLCICGTRGLWVRDH